MFPARRAINNNMAHHEAVGGDEVVPPETGYEIARELVKRVEEAIQPATPILKVAFLPDFSLGEAAKLPDPFYHGADTVRVVPGVLYGDGVEHCDVIVEGPETGMDGNLRYVVYPSRPRHWRAARFFADERPAETSEGSEGEMRMGNKYNYARGVSNMYTETPTSVQAVIAGLYERSHHSMQVEATFTIPRLTPNPD